MNIRFVFALPIAFACLSTHAGSNPQPQIASKVNEPWVMVETHVTTQNFGGAIGGAFQEFSSKERCEAAIKLLDDLAKQHRGSLGGSYEVRPIAKCTPK